MTHPTTELAAHIDTSKDKRGQTHRLLALDPQHLFCRDCRQTITVPLATPQTRAKTRGQPRINDPDACPRHIGQWRDTCGPCRSERLAADPNDQPANDKPTLALVRSPIRLSTGQRFLLGRSQSVACRTAACSTR